VAWRELVTRVARSAGLVVHRWPANRFDAAGDSLTLLRGDVDAMVDELQRRRDAFGVSYVSVNGAFFEALAPVVERLAGQ